MTHVALVDDKSYDASDRLRSQLNISGFPTVYYDGGDTVGVGGTYDESHYRGRIEACGARVVPMLDVLTKIDHISGTTYEITVVIGNGVIVNEKPLVPTQAVGPSYAKPDSTVSFRAASTDPNSNDLFYQFDWNDGTVSDWVGPYSSGDSCTANNSWDTDGHYNVKVRTIDVWNYASSWSPAHDLSVGCCIGARGNVNNGPDDGTLIGSVDISDLIFMVAYAFQGGDEPVCINEADINASGGDVPVDISDIINLVGFMFQGGIAPVACP